MKYFIFISRFSQEKNPDIIIHAFRLLDRSDIGLVMLGKNLCGMSFKKQESTNIIMPGFSNRVYDYIIASDFLYIGFQYRRIGEYLVGKYECWTSYAFV